MFLFHFFLSFITITIYKERSKKMTDKFNNILFAKARENDEDEMLAEALALYEQHLNEEN